MPASLLAHGTFKPRTTDAWHRLVPPDHDWSSIDEEIRRSAKQAPCFFAPSDLDLGPFGQGATLEQVPDVQSCIRLDQTIARHADVVVIFL
jgi:hypothetical protein